MASPTISRRPMSPNQNILFGKSAFRDCKTVFYFENQYRNPGKTLSRLNIQNGFVLTKKWRAFFYAT